MSSADGMCPHNNPANYCPSCASQRGDPRGLYRDMACHDYYPLMNGRSAMGGNIDVGAAGQAAIDALVRGAQGLLPQAAAAAGQSLLSQPGVQDVVAQTAMEKTVENILKHKWIYLGALGAVLLMVFVMARKK